MGILVASLALLAVQADPLDREEFKAPITLAVKRTLIGTFLKQITDKTGVRFTTARSTQDRKVTVFAKDKPIKDVLSAIEDVLDCQLMADGTAINVRDPNFNDRENYCTQEQYLLWDLAAERMNALAAVTRNRKYDGPVDMVPAKMPFLGGKDEEWADEAAKEPLYYVMGCWWASFPKKSFQLLFSGASYFQIVPMAYPTTQVENAIWNITPNSEPLRGAFIASRYILDTGEWQPAWVKSDRWQKLEKSKKPYRFALPPRQLASLPFAKRALSWPQSLDKELDQVELSGEQEIEPEFVGDRVGLAEVAQDLHRRTGRMIVADDFRLPVQPPDRHIDRLGPYLHDLETKLDVSIKASGEMILLRHPAFWRLAKSEPPEGATLAIEAKERKEPLGLADYVAYSSALAAPFYSGGQRFLCPDWLLVKFDARPLYEALPAIQVLAQLSPRMAERAMAGDTFRWSGVKEGSRVFGEFKLVPPAGCLAPFYRHQTDEKFYPLVETAGPSLCGKNAGSLSRHLRSTGNWDDRLNPLEFSNAMTDYQIRYFSNGQVKFRIGHEGYAVTAYVTSFGNARPPVGEDDDGGR